MKIGSLAALGVIAAFGVSTTASAQVGKDLNEFAVAGAVTINDAGDDTETSMNLNVAYGRMISDRFELGGTAGVTKLEDVDTFGDVGAFAEYHFGDTQSTRVPYIGAGVALGYGSEGDDPLIYGAYVGLKWFIGQGGGGAIRLEPYYERVDFDNFDFNTYGVRLGYSLWF